MNDLIKELEGIGDEFAPETGQWDYPTIGYNTATGDFYLGDDTVGEIGGVVVLVVRRCKEVETDTGGSFRYGVYTKREKMQLGKVKQRLQAVVMVSDQPYVYGARSWTARALFDNDPGKYMDEKLMPGLASAMRTWLKQVASSHKVQTDMYCWKFNLSTGKAFKNPQDKSRSITPIVYSWPPEFVGRDKALEYKTFIDSENLKAWADEWHKAGGAQVENAADDGNAIVEDKIEDIPGFDL
jgi:hypothetical protein